MDAVRYRECMKDNISRLAWHNQHLLHRQFTILCNLCEEEHLSFWDLVEEIGGLFAIQILMHALRK